MRGAVVLALACVSTNVLAQPSPGTFGDPINELAIAPGVVAAGDGLAIHGGAPEDTVVVFDGFEVPWLYERTGLRSIVPSQGVASVDVLTGAFGAEHGRGSSVVVLGPQRHALELLKRRARSHLDVSSLDGLAQVRFAHERSRVIASVRYGPDEPFVLDEPFEHAGAQLVAEHALSRRWTVRLSGLASMLRDERPIQQLTVRRHFIRPIASAEYQHGPWSATIAMSSMLRNSELVHPGPLLDPDRLEVRQNTFDTRTEVRRQIGRVAGLGAFAVRFGGQTNASRYRLDVTWPELPREGINEPQTLDPAEPREVRDEKIWRTDAAAWAAASGNLSPSIRATAGLRVDLFDGEPSLQPRVQLEGKLRPDLQLVVAGGTYRRPPDEIDELLAGSLHAERATHVAAGTRYDMSKRARIEARAYHVDRTRLVMRDPLGELTNTGRGTASGLDVLVTLRGGPWHGLVSATLSRSKRLEFPRATERPFQYEQPFRVDAVGAWSRGRWRLAARLRLASGLPYTPIESAVYNSDTDFFEPTFALRTYADRLPFHHQIDLRADVRFRIAGFTCEGYVDLHNAYANRGAIAYRYSHDYRQRVDVAALPLYPFAGMRIYL